MASREKCEMVPQKQVRKAKKEPELDNKVFRAAPLMPGTGHWPQTEDNQKNQGYEQLAANVL